jgi:hypothetical protein
MLIASTRLPSETERATQTLSVTRGPMERTMTSAGNTLRTPFPGGRTALVAIGVLSVVTWGALYSSAMLKSDKTKPETLRIGVHCDLTTTAVPNKQGAGFVLKASCPQGMANVTPSLSLWLALIEALPSEKRLVQCSVRGDGSYANCRKTEEFASR